MPTPEVAVLSEAFLKLLDENVSPWAIRKGEGNMDAETVTRVLGTDIGDRLVPDREALGDELKKFQALSWLSKKALAAVAKEGKLVLYSEGEPIFFQDQTSDFSVLLLFGKVGLYSCKHAVDEKSFQYAIKKGFTPNAIERAIGKCKKIVEAGDIVDEELLSRVPMLRRPVSALAASPKVLVLQVPPLGPFLFSTAINGGNQLVMIDCQPCFHRKRLTIDPLFRSADDTHHIDCFLSRYPSYSAESCLRSRTALCRTGIFMSCKTSQIIIGQGSAKTHAFLVLKGNVTAFHMDPGGGPPNFEAYRNSTLPPEKSLGKALRTSAPGDWFGASLRVISSPDETMRETMVATAPGTELYCLPVADFESFLDSQKGSYFGEEAWMQQAIDSKNKYLSFHSSITPLQKAAMLKTLKFFQMMPMETCVSIAPLFQPYSLVTGHALEKGKLFFIISGTVLVQDSKDGSVMKVSQAGDMFCSLQPTISSANSFAKSSVASPSPANLFSPHPVVGVPSSHPSLNIDGTVGNPGLAIYIPFPEFAVAVGMVNGADKILPIPRRFMVSATKSSSVSLSRSSSKNASQLSLFAQENAKKMLQSPSLVRSPSFAKKVEAFTPPSRRRLVVEFGTPSSPGGSPFEAREDLEWADPLTFVAKVLESVSCLQGTAAQFIQDMSRVAMARVYETNEMIFAQGDAATSIFVILSGSVSFHERKGAVPTLTRTTSNDGSERPVSSTTARSTSITPSLKPHPPAQQQAEDSSSMSPITPQSLIRTRFNSRLGEKLSVLVAPTAEATEEVPKLPKQDSVSSIKSESGTEIEGTTPVSLPSPRSKETSAFERMQAFKRQHWKGKAIKKVLNAKKLLAKTRWSSDGTVAGIVRRTGIEGEIGRCMDAGWPGSLFGHSCLLEGQETRIFSAMARERVVLAEFPLEHLSQQLIAELRNTFMRYPVKKWVLSGDGENRPRTETDIIAIAKLYKDAIGSTKLGELPSSFLIDIAKKSLLSHFQADERILMDGEQVFRQYVLVSGCMTQIEKKIIEMGEDHYYQLQYQHHHHQHGTQSHAHHLHRYQDIESTVYEGGFGLDKIAADRDEPSWSKYSFVAKEPVDVVSIDKHVLNKIMAAFDHSVTTKISAILRELPGFRRWKENQVISMIRLCSRLTFSAREAIVHQDNPVDGMILVLEGQCRVKKKLHHGNNNNSNNSNNNKMATTDIVTLLVNELDEKEMEAMQKEQEMEEEEDKDNGDDGVENNPHCSEQGQLQQQQLHQKESQIAIIGPCSLIGNSGNGHRHQASVVAITDVVCLHIPLKHLNNMDRATQSDLEDIVAVMTSRRQEKLNSLELDPNAEAERFKKKPVICEEELPQLVAQRKKRVMYELAAMGVIQPGPKPLKELLQDMHWYVPMSKRSVMRAVVATEAESYKKWLEEQDQLAVAKKKEAETSRLVPKLPLFNHLVGGNVAPPLPSSPPHIVGISPRVGRHCFPSEFPRKKSTINPEDASLSVLPQFPSQLNKRVSPRTIADNPHRVRVPKQSEENGTIRSSMVCAISAVYGKGEAGPLSWRNLDPEDHPTWAMGSVQIAQKAKDRQAQDQMVVDNSMTTMHYEGNAFKTKVLPNHRHLRSATFRAPVIQSEAGLSIIAASSRSWRECAAYGMKPGEVLELNTTMSPMEISATAQASRVWKNQPIWNFIPLPPSPDVQESEKRTVPIVMEKSILALITSGKRADLNTASSMFTDRSSFTDHTEE